LSDEGAVETPPGSGRAIGVVHHVRSSLLLIITIFFSLLKMKISLLSQPRGDVTKPKTKRQKETPRVLHLEDEEEAERC
jgi:hypothetical protein